MAEYDRITHSTDIVDDLSATNGHVNTAVEEPSDTENTDPMSNLMMLPFTEARARALEDFDRKFLSAALARHNGNIARTARALGLHRQSLQKLMARRGIKSIRTPAGSTPAVPERKDADQE